MSEVQIFGGPATRTLGELAAVAAGPLQRAGAERAVAFGSYARDTADAYSDLDLVVVLATDLPRLSRGPLVEELIEALPIAVDAVVLTPEEYQRGVDRGLGLFDHLSREGVTVYERS